ncbi:MAG: xanthine dehydrogenase small subunit [Pseudomonadota bacterium]
MAAETSFLLNGLETTTSVRPDTTVLNYLRDTQKARGTKEGCAEGDCGACTVLLQRIGTNGGKPVAANSCIMTVGQADGASITTVEGLKSDGQLSALQSAMACNGSSQCGFCTPGFVMAATGLLASNASPREEEIHEAIAGNLCRCTGYRPIVEAIQDAAGRCDLIEAPAILTVTENTSCSGSTYHRPRSLNELLVLKAENPDALILAGGTDLGVAHAAFEDRWSDIIATGNVDELRVCQATDTVFEIGAAATWHEMKELVAADYPSLATLLSRFGSVQIRSMGTVGGNIATASPIGDGPPSLIALGAEITLASYAHGQRTLPLEDFFLDYRKTVIRPDEVIVSITLPRKKAQTHFRVWKISKRYDQDISTVCGAFALELDGDRIMAARVAYGGMAAIPKRATSVEKALTGKLLDTTTCMQAGAEIENDFAALSDWRGSAEYRMDVAEGLPLRLAHDFAGERVEVMA